MTTAVRRRLWYATQAELDTVSDLPDGTPVGAQDTGRTFIYDAVRGLVSDLPDGSAGEILGLDADAFPTFLTQHIATTPTVASLNGDATETNIITGTLPAGAMGSNGRFRAHTHFQPANRTGATQQWTMRLRATPVGGVEQTLIAELFEVPPLASNTNVYRGLFEVELVNLNDPASQAFSLRCSVALKTVGQALVDQFSIGYTFPVANDIDTAAVDNDFRMTFQMGVANAGYTFTYRPAYAEAVYIP